MEEYKKLQSYLDESTYKELELFWINNINFTDGQSSRFVKLIEKINTHSREVKSKQHPESTF